MDNIKQVTNLDNLKNMLKELDFKYALIYMISELNIVKKDEFDFNIDWDEILEARFFCEDFELYMFDYNGDKKIRFINDINSSYEINILTCETSLISYEINELTCETNIIKYEIESGHDKYGKFLKTKEYIEFDDDGQAFVKMTRIVDISNTL